MTSAKSSLSQYFFGFSLALLAGCNSPGTANNLVPVSGLVTVDGKYLKSGTVSFIPENDKAATATGKISFKSMYFVSTDDKPGVAPGRYNVVVEGPDGLKLTTTVEVVVSDEKGPRYNLVLKKEPELKKEK